MKNLLKSKVYNYIRSLNWGVAFLILCLSYLGTITNENIKTWNEALILGTLIGIPSAILCAFIFKNIK